MTHNLHPHGYRNQYISGEKRLFTSDLLKEPHAAVVTKETVQALCSLHRVVPALGSDSRFVLGLALCCHRILSPLSSLLSPLSSLLTTWPAPAVAATSTLGTKQGRLFHGRNKGFHWDHTESRRQQNHDFPQLPSHQTMALFFPQRTHDTCW